MAVNVTNAKINHPAEYILPNSLPFPRKLIFTLKYPAFQSMISHARIHPLLQISLRKPGLEISMPCRHHFVTPLFAMMMLFGAFHLAQTPAHAQNACDQELLMDTRATGRPNANTQPCREFNRDSRAIQQQAQARIEARERWNALAPALKACLDDAFRLEATSVEVLIGDGVLPSFDNTVGYLNQRKIKC